jgi:hypothetical protein
MNALKLIMITLFLSFFFITFSSCSADSDLFADALQNEISKDLDKETEEENESEEENEEQEEENEEQEEETNPEESENPTTGGVNFNEFGVVGDGVSDDTAALQAALDSGKDLVSNSGLTFKVSSTININKDGDQSVDWNGSTISVAQNNLVTFIITKPNGSMLTMSRLLIEGNSLAQDGFQINSPIAFDDVDVRNLFSATNAPQAFVVNFDEEFTKNSTMVNCDCTGLNGRNNNVIGDAIGASRCLSFYASGIPNNKSTFTLRDFKFGEVWSEDGDVIEILDSLFEDTGHDIGETYTALIIDTGSISNWGRRGVKGTGGGYHIKNVVFNPANASNRNLPSSSKLGPSGIIAMGHTYFPAGSGSTGTYGIASGGIIENCVFNGSTYDKQVIITRSDNMIFRNNKLNSGADLQFQQNPRKISICNNEFGPGSIIYEQGAVYSPNVSDIKINSDNTFVETDYNKLKNWKSTESSYSCGQ